MRIDCKWRSLAIAGLLTCCVLSGVPSVYGRSASSPRHTGMEPPGGPRSMDVMPARPLSRTPDGGRGYTDAYGNAVEDMPPQEKKVRQRPRPGAFGSYGQREKQRPLPDPGAAQSSPLWKFE